MAYTFPHPILDSSNDVYGIFEPNWDNLVSREAKTLSIRTTELGINNDYFNKLIDKKIAHVCIRIFCPDILFSWSQKIDLNNSIDIPIDEIDGKIEIQYMIISADDYNNYTDSSFNEIYQGTIFKLNKNDIIGLSHKTLLNTEHLFESNQKNMFHMVADPDIKFVQYNIGADRIIINYPCQKSNNIPGFHDKFNRLSKSNLVLTFFYPCFIHIFYNLIDDSDDDLKIYKWYQKLIEIIGDQEWEFVRPEKLAWEVVNTYKNILASSYNELSQRN